MERNVLEFIREHKIIAIVRGIPSAQIVQLVQAMVKAFPDGRLVFDTAAIQDVGSYFSISDAKNELSPQSRNLQISSRDICWGIRA